MNSKKILMLMMLAACSGVFGSQRQQGRFYEDFVAAQKQFPRLTYHQYSAYLQMKAELGGQIDLSLSQYLANIEDLSPSAAASETKYYKNYEANRYPSAAAFAHAVEDDDTAQVEDDFSAAAYADRVVGDDDGAKVEYDSEAEAYAARIMDEHEDGGTIEEPDTAYANRLGDIDPSDFEEDQADVYARDQRDRMNDPELGDRFSYARSRK